MDTICIANARVVDVVHGTVSPERSLLVENGRIGELLPAPPANARMFHARGLYVVPGLIDGHVHFALDGGADPRSTFLNSGEPALWEIGRRNAQAAIAAGITTARDCGAPAPWIFDFQQAVARGDFPGPTIICCGRPLTRPGGHLHYFGGEVSTRPQVRALVEQQVRQGAGFVKLIASGGGLTPGTQPSEAELPVELMREAADVARALRVHSAAHCHATESIVRALDAGIEIIEHASFIAADRAHRFDEQIATRIRESGCVVCPTVIGALRTVQRLRHFDPQGSDAGNATIVRLEARRSNLASFYRLRLPMLGGTDCGITDTPFDSLIDELLLYREAGMTAPEALRSVTCDAAKYLNIAGTGEVARGYAADLILLERNPLEDLAALRNPVAVLKAGRFVAQRRVPAREAASVPAAFS